MASPSEDASSQARRPSERYKKRQVLDHSDNDLQPESSTKALVSPSIPTTPQAADQAERRESISSTGRTKRSTATKKGYYYEVDENGGFTRQKGE
jgi:hypothetical protein